MARLRAWYIGAENLEIFARYGSNTMFRHIFNEWRSAFLAAAVMLLTMWNHQTNDRADEVLDAYERNRKAFYQRDFAPPQAPIENTPIHDGVKGFQYVDSAAPDGLKVDVESNIVGPPRVALRRITETLDVTPLMLQDAKALKAAIARHRD
jgi:hypothetical protein